MTHETIEKIIDDLNNGSQDAECVVRMGLSENVDYAKIWLEAPKGGVYGDFPYEMFLIKNEEGGYVAAVLDMQHDLHVFVKQEHRERGYLSKAIDAVILPWLWQNERQSQTVTFDDARIGQYVQKNWGFALSDDERTASKDLSEYSTRPRITPKRYGISEQESRRITNRVDMVRKNLKMIAEQFQIAFGTESGTELEELIDALLYTDDRLLTSIEDHNATLQRAPEPPALGT